MSQYIKSPFKPSPVLAVAGTPTYLLGSWNDKTGPTIGQVISNSAVTTTGTLVFQIISGNVPANGSLITVVGCANSANFNVTNATVTVVSTTAAGVCTVTYTITSTSQGSLADSGQVIIPQPETGDTVASTPYYSVPASRPFNNPNINEGQSLTATVNILTGLTGVTAVLQGADIDLDSEYVTIHTFGTGLGTGLVSFQSGQDVVAAGTANPGGANQLNYRFYRLGLTAGSGPGTVVGKIEF